MVTPHWMLKMFVLLPLSFVPEDIHLILVSPKCIYFFAFLILSFKPKNCFEIAYDFNKRYSAKSRTQSFNAL